MTDEYKLDEETHNTILKDLKENTFAGVNPVDNPQFHVSGGQPAAGKSVLIQAAAKEMPDGNYVIINGDEFRYAHPQAQEIFEKHDKEFSAYTDPDVRTWTSSVLEGAVDNQYNIIFEGTMRTNRICDTIKDLRAKNYHVHIKAMAVNELESGLSIHQRYEDMLEKSSIARFTERKNHDAAYTGMPQTLQQIEDEKLYDSLTVYKRDGSVVFRSDRDDPKTGVVQALEAARNEPWSQEKFMDYQRQADSLISRIKTRGGPEEQIADISRLKKEAAIKMYKDRKQSMTQESSNGLSRLRQKMAGKVDQALGTNLEKAKLPAPLKKIESSVYAAYQKITSNDR